MSLSCPRCAQQVTPPAGIAPNTRVRCPVCQGEFVFSEVRACLPPTLQIVDEFAESDIAEPSTDAPVAALAEDAFELPAPEDSSEEFSLDDLAGDDSSVSPLSDELPDFSDVPAATAGADAETTEEDWNFEAIEMDDESPALEATPHAPAAEQISAADAGVEGLELPDDLPLDTSIRMEEARLMGEEEPDFSSDDPLDFSSEEPLDFGTAEPATRAVSPDEDPLEVAGPDDFLSHSAPSEAPTQLFESAPDEEGIHFDFDPVAAESSPAIVENTAAHGWQPAEDGSDDLELDFGAPIEAGASIEPTSDIPADEEIALDFGEAVNEPPASALPVAAALPSDEPTSGKKKKKKEKPAKAPKATADGDKPPRKRGLVGLLAQVVLSAILAVPIAYYIGLWISPEWDLLALGPKLPAWIVPAGYHRAGGGSLIAKAPTSPVQLPPTAAPVDDAQPEPAAPAAAEPSATAEAEMPAAADAAVSNEAPPATEPREVPADKPATPPANAVADTPAPTTAPAEAMPADDASPLEATDTAAAPATEPDAVDSLLDGDTTPAPTAPADDVIGLTDAPADEAAAMPADDAEMPAEDAAATDDQLPGEDATVTDEKAKPAKEADDLDLLLNDNAADAPAEEMPADDMPAEDATPEEAATDAAPDLNDAPDLTDRPGADEPADDMPADEPAPLDAVTDKPADDAAAEDMPAEDAAPADSLLDEPAPEAAPATPAEDMPADDLPLDDAAAPAVEESPEPVGPRQSREYSAAEVSKTLGDAMKARENMAAAQAGQDEAALKKARARLYLSLFGLADVVTFAKDDPAQPQLGPQRQVLQQAILQFASDPKRLEALKFNAGRWMTFAKRTTPGIMVAGTVEKVDQVGKLYHVHLNPGGNAPAVTVITATNPQRAPSDEAFALGSIIEHPAQELAGYQGDDGAVVWSGMTFKLPPQSN